MTDDIKPSDIVLLGPMPLTATFNRSEVEAAAAWLIHALAAGGDTWRPIALSDVARHVRGVVEEPDHPRWFENPFFRPDFAELVKRGFAKTGPTETPPWTIEFTEHGLDALRRSGWVRPAA